MNRAIPLCTIVLVALVAAGGAVAAPPTGTPGWVNYPAPTDIGPATRQQVQGTLSLSTLDCVFSFSGSVAPGSPGVQWAQVAYDPSTCRAVYLVGTAKASAAPAAPASGVAVSATSGAQTTPTPRAATSIAAAAASSTSAAYLRTWYEDPATIDVNSLREDDEWTHNGSCNTSFQWKRNAAWFTPSGWYLQYANDSWGFSCANAVINSDAKMENDSFCWAFNDPENVWSVYNYNHDVVGKADGSYTYEYNDYVNSTLSICYRLLNHRAGTGFETPW